MKSRLPVIRNTGLVLGIIGAALLSLPSRTTAQTVKRDPLSVFSLASGSVEIGVTVRDLGESDAQAAKLAAPAGAYIQNVRTDSPASRAGLREADVIVTFDGERVRSASHFARLVDETPDGRAVPVVVQRGGERVTLNVAPESSLRARALTLNRAPALADRNAFSVKVAPDVFNNLSVFRAFGTSRFGLTVQDLSGQLGDYFGTKTGVLVTSVNENSPARSAGVRAGDVITRVNDQEVSNTADLRRGLGEGTSDATLTIMRDHKEQTLKVAPATRQGPRTTIVR
jgi:S1-C subfamily serine protease